MSAKKNNINSKFERLVKTKKSKTFSFKKNLRSFAIMLLSLLTVVSFSVGISTFDSDYKIKAQAAVIAFFDGSTMKAVPDAYTDDTSRVSITPMGMSGGNKNITYNETSYTYALRTGGKSQNSSGSERVVKIEVPANYTVKLTYAGTANGTTEVFAFISTTITSIKDDTISSISSKVNGGTASYITANLSSGTYYLCATASFNYCYIGVDITATAATTTYSVTYNANTTDTVNNMPEKVTLESANGNYQLSDATPTRTGYTFGGWAESADSTTAITNLNVDGEKTVYAIWTPITYTITFNTNGGSGTADNISATYGVEYSLPTGLTKTDYTFAGWSLANDGTADYTDKVVNLTTTNGETVTLYAIWTEAEKITVTFMNGSTVYTTLTVDATGKVTRPADPSERPAGISNSAWFGGWWTKDGSSWGSSETYKTGLSGWGYVFDFDAEITENTTAYALWMDPVDTDSFRTYVDNMIKTAITNPYAKPDWGSEGFKGKWNYIDGVFFNSVVNLYYNTSETDTITYTDWNGTTVTNGNKKEFYLHFLSNYVSDYINEDGKFVTVKSSGPTTSITSSSTLDFICESKILFDLYYFTGEEKYLKAVDTTKGILDGITKVEGSEITIDGTTYYNYSHQNGNGCTGEIWLDGMYMYAPFLTRYLNATGAELSAYQQLLAQYSFILQKMRDSTTGLYYHAYAGSNATESVAWKCDNGCSPAFWSRSMGWFITSLIDVIELMPDGVPVAQGIIDRIPANFSTAYGNNVSTTDGKAFLQSMLKDAIDALLAYQDPNSKMIYQVIDGGIKAGNYQNYLESSGSSMLAYTVMKAARLFLNGQTSKDGKTYAERGMEMFEGIYNHSLHNNSLYDICKMANLNNMTGNTKETAYAYYLNKSDTQITYNDGKGSGPFTMAFIEYDSLKNSATPTQPVTLNINNRRVNIVVGENTYVLSVVKGESFTLAQAQEVVSSATLNALYTDEGKATAYDYSAVNQDITLYADATSGSLINITISVNGVEEVKSCAQGGSITLTDPSVSDKIFKGWLVGSDATLKSSAEVNAMTFSEATTITASFVDAFTVTYNANTTQSWTGTLPSETTVESGSTYTVSANELSIVGYTFKGWATTESGTTAVMEIANISADVTLYAIWEINKYSVTFTVDGNIYGTTQTIDHGSSAIAPENPVKDGWTFNGWQIDGTGTVYTATEVNALDITANTNFVAKWTEVDKYTVTYVDGVDGEEITVPTDSNTYASGASVTVSSTEPTRTGYTFGGWSDGTNSYSAGATLTMPANNVTLTAQWTANQYTIAFNKNNESASGSMDSIVATYGQATGLPEIGFTLSGYTFSGWATTATGSVQYRNKESVENLTATNGDTVTLYAVWTVESTQVTVTYDFSDVITAVSNVSNYSDYPKFNGNYNLTHTIGVDTPTGWTDSSVKTLTDTLSVGASLATQYVSDAETPSNYINRLNYTLSGWVDADDSTNTVLTTVPSGKTTITLKPVWTPKNKDTIISENLTESAISTYGNAVTWSSYIFDENGSYAVNDANNSRKNIRFTDLYTATDGYYNLYSNATYGSVSINAGCGVDGTHRSVTEPMVVCLKGNEFLKVTVNSGYFAKITVYGTVYSVGDADTIFGVTKSGETTATNLSGTITAIFNTNAEYTASNPTVNKNDFIGITPSAVTSGYLSNGTYSVTNTSATKGKNVFVTGFKVEFVKAATVAFNANNGVSSENSTQSVAIGDSVTLPSAPSTVPDGKQFAGWEIGTEVFSAGSSYTVNSENVEFTAKWIDASIAIYTVTFDPKGGTFGDGTTENKTISNIESGSTISDGEITLMDRTDYNFDGWFYKEGDVENQFVFGTTQVTSDLSLYAKWTYTGTTTTQTVSIYNNGEQLAQPDTTYGGIEYYFTGLTGKGEYSSITVDGNTVSPATVLKTGGSAKSSRYISIKVPSSVYSSFKVKVVVAPNGSTEAKIWVSQTIDSTPGSGDNLIVTTGTNNLTYITGTSESFATNDGSGDITYYLNFSASARFYEISLELERNTSSKNVITFITDNEDTHPIEGIAQVELGQETTSYQITQTPTLTSNASAYTFAYWQDGAGKKYNVGDTITDITTGITLTAYWNEIITSITAPTAERDRIPLSQAQSSGLGLPDTVVANLASGGTCILDITWNLAGASYKATASDGIVNKDISDSANIVKGFYTVTSNALSLPTGYVLSEGVKTSWSVTVETYEIEETTVMAGAGYRAIDGTLWNNGKTPVNDIYTLDTNGEVSITVHSERVGTAQTNGYIDLIGNTTVSASNAPITITMPSEYSAVIIAIRTTKSTSGYIKLLNSSGEEIATTLTQGVDFNTITVNSATDTAFSGNIYVCATNAAEIVSIVANAQYNLETVSTTYKVTYWTKISETSYTEDGKIILPYNYIENAKIVVGRQDTYLGDHKIFSHWATALDSGATYNPGDVLTVSDNVDLYAISKDEPKIKVTFDLNPPAGMTTEEITTAFGSLSGFNTQNCSVIYEIYSGQKLSEVGEEYIVPTFTTITAGGKEFTFDGWSPNITRDTVIANSETYTANWITATLDIKVNDIALSVSEGTAQAEIGLPQSLTALDGNGNVANLDEVVVGAWEEVVSYNANADGDYLFRASLTAPYGGAFATSWEGYTFDGTTYERSIDGTFYVYAKVTVILAQNYATYTADWTAFAYTGSEDRVVYNNNSNTHDKAWSDYYQVATDESAIPGTIVSRNGGIKVIADNETKVSGEITAALVDTDYHGQTWSMIKGFHKTSTNSPFIYVVVPEGAQSVTISVYAVKFRQSQANVPLSIGPKGNPTDTMTVTAHSYTETDHGSDFNYFYDFSPSYYKYSYSGSETVFAISNTHTSTNVYLTGIKVECSLANESSHTIVYNANDGSANPQTRQVVYADNGADGQDVIVEKNFFHREGYQFIGWSTVKGSTTIQETCQVGKSLNLTDNLTLYAVWESARKVTYDANDGSGETFEKFYTNGRGQLADNEFDMTDEVRQDKSFLYWNTKSDGSGESYNPGDIYNPTGIGPDGTASNRYVGVILQDITLYAIWATGDLYTAKYSAYSHEMNAIDMVYTNDSNTFGVDWTTKYSSGLIAKNGSLTVVTNGTSTGAGNLSSPIVKLANGQTITVSVPSAGNVAIIVNAVVANSTNGALTIGDSAFTIDKSFTDGSAFSGFVPATVRKSISVANETGGTITITNSGSVDVYVTGVEVDFAVGAQSATTTVTYDNGYVDSLSDGYSYLIFGETKDFIVDINRFHRDGYTFQGWNTTKDAGASDTYGYGKSVTASSDITLYAQWTPITYKYKFVTPNGSGYDDYVNGTFTLNGTISKPANDPEKGGWTFRGWYLDTNFYQQAFADGDTFAPSFEMIDGDTITFYAYFVENVVTKTEVSPSKIADSEMWILDVVQNVYQEEGSTSASAHVSADALNLPRVINVSDAGGTFSKNLVIDWSNAVNNLTLGSLKSGPQQFTGYIRLSDSDYETYAFTVDEVNNLQQIAVSATVTLNNVIITFPNGALVQDTFTYPSGTKKSDIISQFEVRGQYTFKDQLYAYQPKNLTWVCDNYNSETPDTYAFNTTLYADIGYAFEVEGENGETVEKNTYTTTATVTITGSEQAIAAVGFSGSETRWTVSKSSVDWLIDSNGDVGNELKITAVGNSYDNLADNIAIDIGEGGIRIDVPTCSKLAVYYLSLTTTGKIQIVDGSDTVFAEKDLSTYADGFKNPLVLSNIITAKSLYIKAVDNQVVISKLWVVATGVSTTDQNVVKVKFTHSGKTVYHNGYGDDAGLNTSESDAQLFVRSAKIIAPTFEETNLGNAPADENVSLKGWDYTNGASANFKVGNFIDLDLASSVTVGETIENHVELFAIFDVAFYTLTFDTGFGETLEIHVPIGQTVGSVIDIEDANKDSRLVELEKSRIGYSVEGWYIDASYKTKLYEGLILNTDLVVYAKWTAKNYTVQYVNGEQVLETANVVFDQAFSAPTVVPKYSDDTRTFRCWQFAGYDWIFGQFTLASHNAGTIESDTTVVRFIADFGAKVTYVTEYEGIAGSALPKVEDENVYVIGYEYPTNKTTGLSGYEFVGWAYDKNHNPDDADNVFTADETITLTKNVTLYAVWRAKQVTVKFESGDAKISFTKTPDNQTVSYNATINLPTPTAEASGYVVHSWYYKDGEEEITWVFDGSNPSRVLQENELTLYARWGVTVSFGKFDVDTKEDIVVTPWYDDIIVAIGDTIPFIHTAGQPSGNGGIIHVEPQIPGYLFKGWFKNIADVSDANKFGIDTVIGYGNNGGLKIYAGFEKASETDVTVTFEDSYGVGATMPGAVRVKLASQLTLTDDHIPTDVPAYATFVGWTLYPDGTGDVYEKGESVYVSGNIKLYALWSIEIDSVVLSQVTVLSDEVLQSKLYYELSGFAGTKEFNGVFEVQWILTQATNENGETVDLTLGAHRIASGSYAVPVRLLLQNGYVWVGTQGEITDTGITEPQTLETTITVVIKDGTATYYVVAIENITDEIGISSDYRLTTVIALINTDSTATSGDEISLQVTWNSQIDTTIIGKHYVLGQVVLGRYKLKTGVSQSVSATVTVKNGATTNEYLYKTYQDGSMPDAPTAPSGFTFLCWTNKGVTAVGENAKADAGEWTATYVKLSFKEGASIRLNKDYTGIRFSAYLEFFGSKYVSELMRNKSNQNGAVSVTMTFNYESAGNTYNIGTGQDFMNMTQAINAEGNAVITFSGVISDLVVYDESGNAVNKTNCSTLFTPIAKVKLNGGEAISLTAGFSRSASDVAKSVLETYPSLYPSGSYGNKVLNDYVVS